MNYDELFKRIDEEKIAPQFLEKCKELVKICHEKHGKVFYAISGWRDPQEQARLYSIGRTTQKDKKPVTNAKPFRSFHNFGLALDFCLDKDIDRAGLQPDWDYTSYKVLADEAKNLGLTPGYYFKSFPEGPHIQFQGHLTLDQMEKLYVSHSLEKIWEKLDLI